ncbi:hypothetical protein QQ045_032675 [Rhodiola kirilowii]
MMTLINYESLNLKKKKKSKNRKRKTVKFVLGKQVEVRSDEDGFQGSWHSATVIACGVGFCKVRYVHLLDNDGKDYLVDTVNISENLDCEIEVQERSDIGHVNNIRPLRQDVGFAKFGLYYGLCVDALHNDAWWEGVVFDNEDGLDTRSVFFPDLGDELKFEIGMLRQAWDWDEYNEEWIRRGDWVLLKMVEEFEKDCPLMVSVKQLWYDLQEKVCFNKVGKWKCRDEALWREAMLELTDRYFTMTVNDIYDSLGCLTEMDSEALPLTNTVDTDLSSAIVVTKCASDKGYKCTELQLGDDMSTVTSSASSEGKYGFNLVDSKSKDRVWLNAENVMVFEPEFCPDVITEYLRMSENLRKTLTHKLRKHLLYLGWKVEYRKETSQTRMRYTSPTGKFYMSLVKICEDMSRDSGALGTLSEDKGSQPPTKIRPIEIKMLLDRPADSQKPNVTPSTSVEDAVFEPEFCPEAIENWCKYISSTGKLGSHSKVVNSLQVKKHLSALGWSFSYVYKNNRRGLRYLSPKGNCYSSLRRACKVCIKDNETGKRGTPRNYKPTENTVVIKSSASAECLSSPNVSSVITTSKAKHSSTFRTPNQLNVDSRQPLDLVVQNLLEIEENQEAKQNERADGIQTESVRGRKRRTTLEKHASKPAVRTSKRIREAASHIPYHNNPRTVLSWLFDNNAVLPGAIVEYISRKDGQPLKEGRVSREGIRCNCCDEIYSLSAFEAHAGSSVRRPSANIFLKDGKSLMECQRKLLNKANEQITKKKSHSKVKRVYPENDISCSVCHYGGELMLCDRCPASFHMICLGLEEVPDGDWFCPSCSCVNCGRGELKDMFSEDDVLRCYQCELQYHLSCLKERNIAILDMDAEGNRFCSSRCKKICSGLNNLLGKPFALGSDNLTWTLVAANKCGSSQPDLADMDTLTENYSKLNVALSIMHECFEPIKDPRTKRDIVEDAIFSRSSEHSRLNYRGFYTVILEQNEELITAATVRIFGDKVAEMPLVGTRFNYRRLGMCRFLMDELERKLKELGIERLVLPAVPSVVKTWTTSFGFSQMTEADRLQLLSYKFLDFPGTSLCQKFLQDTLPATAIPLQGPQYEVANVESTRAVDYVVELRQKTDELRKCDGSVVLDNQTKDGASVMDELRQPSEMLQVRNEEQIVAHETHPSEHEKEITNADQQTTAQVPDDCTSLRLQKTPDVCELNHEDEYVPEMVQVQGCWAEQKHLSEMLQPGHEKKNIIITSDQQIINYHSDGKFSQGPQTTPVTCQLSRKKHDASEIGQERSRKEQLISSSETTPPQHEELKKNTNKQNLSTSMLNEERTGDEQFRLAFPASQHTPIPPHQSSMGPSNTSTNLKRKSGDLDISNLKVYKRRVRKATQMS